MASEAMFIWIRRCVLVRTIHRTFASTWRWQPRIMPSAGLPRRSDTAAKAVQQRQGFSGGHRIYVASLRKLDRLMRHARRSTASRTHSRRFRLLGLSRMPLGRWGQCPKYLEGMRKADRPIELG
jgi:hypothetical protein